MSAGSKVLLVASDSIWQSANDAAPALRVFASLEALLKAGVRLVLLAPSDSEAAAVSKLCESQGVKFDSAHAGVFDDSVMAKVLSLSPNLSDCLLVGGSASLRTTAERLGLTSRPFGQGEAATNWPELARVLTARRAVIDRSTKETRITGQIDLDATGPISVATGIGFFDHMLEQIAKHGGFSLELSCEGDLHIDEHHTIEDCALALGDALRRALGSKLGIARYGFLLPMDEAEAQVSVDLSGRAYAVFEGRFGRDAVGGMPTELVPHFFRSLAESLGAALHVQVRGENTHHMIEACFKAVGRALRQAFRRDGADLPTTKGVL
jgi:imidazoleglycerol phosphate dehydratase HisB